MKRLALIAGSVLGLLLLTALALPFLIDPNRFRPMLEKELTQALAREVKLGDLKLSILSGAVTAGDLSIAENPAYGRDPFVQAKSLAVAVEIWPLIASKQLHVTGLTIDHPSINLIQAANGDWNFSNLGGKSEAKPKDTSTSDMDLSVKLVKITGGRFSLGRTAAHERPLVLEDVNIEVKDFSATSAFPFSLATKVAGGGSIKLDGTAGPLNRDDTAASPFTVNLNVDQLDVAGSGLTQHAPAVAGLISLTGSCAFDGKTAEIKGKLKGEKLKLAKGGTPYKRTVEFDFADHHDMKKRSGRLEQGDIHIGSAPAKLSGTYSEQGESMALHMKLDGEKMSIPELTGMLPALGIALPHGSSFQGGTATVRLAMDGVLDRLVTAGSVSFDNTKLAGFDLGKKMDTIERLAGIKGGPDTEIQVFSTNVKMSPEGMAADNIKFIAPAIGTLDGGGTMSPTNALDFKMRATVNTSGVAAVVANTPIPFTVSGTASDPVFRPDVKAVVKEEATKAVEKAAGGLLKGLLGGKK
jgi:AsmA protein